MRFLKLLLVPVVIGFILIFQQGKNSESMEVSFESYSERAKVFKEISHYPVLLRGIAIIYKFPTGLWVLPPYVSIARLFEIIWVQKPTSSLRKITFAPGINIFQAIEIINSTPDLVGPKIDVDNEGFQDTYLFPDTYFYKKGSSRMQIIGMAKKQMQKKTDLLWEKKQANFPLSKKEWIILASIVEKETPRSDEMKNVASAFLFRLKKKMRLQSDATVLYGIRRERGFQVWEDKVLHRHLEIRHKFNTYRFSGLPPEPICLPSEAALKATLEADENFAFPFFIWCKDKTIFSKDFESHKKMKRICLMK